MAIRNIGTVSLKLNAFDKKVRREGERVLHDSARFVLTNLVKISPYVTGTLISSYRVGINGIDRSSSPKQQRSRSAASAAALAQGGKIPTARLGDHIYVSNSVAYAHLVEDGGPKNVARRMFERTVMETRSRFARFL